MKPNIHPQFYKDIKVTCSCGNTFTTDSTKQEIRVEICYKCHPLYTGEKRFIDTLGQVGRFQKRQEIAKTHQDKLSTKKAKKIQKEEQQPKSLRDLLMEI